MHVVTGVLHRWRIECASSVDGKREGCSNCETELPAGDISIHGVKARRAYRSKLPVLEDLEGPCDKAIDVQPVHNPQIPFCMHAGRLPCHGCVML